MTRHPLNDPNAAYWEDLVDEFDFDAAEKAEIQRGADKMIAAHAKALGGKLKIVAEFGDESYILG